MFVSVEAQFITLLVTQKPCHFNFSCSYVNCIVVFELRTGNVFHK